MEKEKKYRPNVAAIVLSSDYPFECKFFIAKRSDMENIWQFPQGGIDEGEDAKSALKRELKEEIGTNEVEIIAEYPQDFTLFAQFRAFSHFLHFFAQKDCPTDSLLYSFLGGSRTKISISSIFSI